jgi:hypothetical protein
MSRNPHEDFSEDEVNSRYPNISQDPQGYKKKEKKEVFPSLHPPEDKKK